MEQYFWEYGVIRKNNFSMEHLNIHIAIRMVADNSESKRLSNGRTDVHSKVTLATVKTDGL